MAKEPRPKGYPKLKNYKPSQFMLPTSRYDKKKADRAVTFIENLCHTKGKWAGTPFWLLPWQEQLIGDIFGIVKADGNRQFRTAFVEICKKVGKSELAAAVALYLLYADNEPTKAKSKEKIDGIVAAIMALDRCIRQEGQSGSVYDERGLLVF